MSIPQQKPGRLTVEWVDPQTGQTKYLPILESKSRDRKYMARMKYRLVSTPPATPDFGVTQVAKPAPVEAPFVKEKSGEDSQTVKQKEKPGPKSKTE